MKTQKMTRNINHKSWRSAPVEREVTRSPHPSLHSPVSRTRGGESARGPVLQTMVSSGPHDSRLSVMEHCQGLFALLCISGSEACAATKDAIFNAVDHVRKNIQRTKRSLVDAFGGSEVSRESKRQRILDQSPDGHCASKDEELPKSRLVGPSDAKPDSLDSSSTDEQDRDSGKPGKEATYTASAGVSLSPVDNCYVDQRDKQVTPSAESDDEGHSPERPKVRDTSQGRGESSLGGDVGGEGDGYRDGERIKKALQGCMQHEGAIVQVRAIPKNPKPFKDSPLLLGYDHIKRNTRWFGRRRRLVITKTARKERTDTPYLHKRLLKNRLKKAAETLDLDCCSAKCMKYQLPRCQAKREAERESRVEPKRSGKNRLCLFPCRS